MLFWASISIILWLSQQRFEQTYQEYAFLLKTISYLKGKMSPWNWNNKYCFPILHWIYFVIGWTNWAKTPISNFSLLYLGLSGFICLGWYELDWVNSVSFSNIFYLRRYIQSNTEYYVIHSTNCLKGYAWTELIVLSCYGIAQKFWSDSLLAAMLILAYYMWSWLCRVVMNPWKCIQPLELCIL